MYCRLGCRLGSGPHCPSTVAAQTRGSRSGGDRRWDGGGGGDRWWGGSGGKWLGDRGGTWWGGRHSPLHEQKRGGGGRTGNGDGGGRGDRDGTRPQAPITTATATTPALGSFVNQYRKLPWRLTEIDSPPPGRSQKTAIELRSVIRWASHKRETYKCATTVDPRNRDLGYP